MYFTGQESLCPKNELAKGWLRLEMVASDHALRTFLHQIWKPSCEKTERMGLQLDGFFVFLLILSQSCFITKHSQKG